MAGHRAAMALGQHNASAFAEAGIQLTAPGVNGIQAVAAIEEDARFASAAPVGDATVLEAARSRTLGSTFVGLWIEGPQLDARLRVEGRHSGVHSREVQNVAHHDGRCLEWSRPGPILLQWLLVRLPLPDDFQTAYVGNRDFLGRGILGVRLIGPDVPPFNRRRRLLGTRENGRQDGEWRKKPSHTEKFNCILEAGGGGSGIRTHVGRIAPI